MAITDFQINSKVRAVLARNWIDLQRIRFSSCRGIVRFHGELCHLGDGRISVSDAIKLESLECELKNVRGVRTVYFDFTNWQKTESGWKCTDKRSSRQPGVATTGKGMILEMKTNKKKEDQGDQGASCTKT